MIRNPLAECLDLPQTPSKPRSRAMNLCLDDGMGVAQTADVLGVIGHVVDLIRVGRGGAAFFSAEWLREKAKLCESRDVELEIGGPLYEVAFLQRKTDAYFAAVAELGVKAIEISENVIRPTLHEIRRDIARARQHGLTVFFEYGRKFPDDDVFDLDEAVAACESALDAGARMVQVERSEIDVAIELAPEVLNRLSDRVGADKLTFEAGPRRPELAGRLLELLGSDVNLASLTLDPANALDGVFLVENARRGMERSVDYAFLQNGAKLAVSMAKDR